jgi:uncharacterized membrane protein
MPSSLPTRPKRGSKRGRDDTPVVTAVSARKHVAPSRRVVRGDRGVKVSRAVTIRRPADELYAFWRDLENLPRIVKHPLEVRRLSDLASHWSASAPPGDRRVEWDAVIINDEPGKLIAWRSREGAEIANAGTVRFSPAPGDEGTEVTVTLEYNPPAGKLGAWLAKLSGEEPAQQVAEALRRFKALMEAGEIPTTEGQTSGRPQNQKNKRK